jgi:hypothetical protein
MGTLIRRKKLHEYTANSHLQDLSLKTLIISRGSSVLPPTSRRGPDADFFGEEIRFSELVFGDAVIRLLGAIVTNRPSSFVFGPMF